MEGHTYHQENMHGDSGGKKEDTITLTKTQMWQIVAGILGVALIISVFTGGFGLREEGTDDITGRAVGEPETDEPYFLGDEDAPVTLVEYSDFQCPFCGRFYSQTLGQIKSEYVETGKVKFVYKDFPIDSIHPQARPAANAARCAGEQDKFWEFHDIVFENQGGLNDGNYKKWAADLGLDTEQFNSCYDSRKYDAQVSADLREGSQNGITGTPGFLLEGQIISGAQPFQVFKTAIDQALAAAG